MAPKQIADQSGIMRDGEALPKPADVATASTNEASVAVPHSPLPWCVAPYPGHVSVVGEPRLVASTRGYMDSRDSGSMDTNDANAAFIVRAVNNHDALLAALKAVTERMELTRDYMLGNADLEDVDAVERARNAIAIAEGGH